jgi:hypothetical protein
MTIGAIAYYRDGVWEELAPREGWTLYVRDEDQHVVWSGAAWGPILSAAQTAGFRNRLLNAAFGINQRAASSNADDTYCLDRWYVLTQSGAIATQIIFDPEPGRYTGIRLTQSQASPQRFGLAQIVEATNIKDLRSQAVAMAARVRCSSAQAIRMAILEWTGTVDSVTSDVVNSWTSTTYTPGNFFISTVSVIAIGAKTPSAATWTDMTQITGSFGAALNNAIVVVWLEGAAAQNVTLDIDQIQLEAGTLCGAFARRPFSEELDLCQRYFEPFLYAATGRWASATAVDGAVSFRQNKRSAPTISVISGGAYGVTRAGTGGYSGAGLTLGYAAPSTTGTLFGVNTANHGASAGEFACFNADSLYADAEL